MATRWAKLAALAASEAGASVHADRDSVTAACVVEYCARAAARDAAGDATLAVDDAAMAMRWPARVILTEHIARWV